MQWKVQLSAAIILNDAHACDIEYHLTCWVTHVQHYPGSKTKEADVDISTACTMQQTASQLSAKIELYSLLKYLMSAGSVLTIDNVEKIYKLLRQCTIYHIQQFHGNNWKS